MPVDELRLVLTVNDFDNAISFYRGALGLKQVAAWQNGSGHGVLLEEGRATLEIFDEAQAQAIDEIEVGRRVAPPRSDLARRRQRHPPAGFASRTGPRTSRSYRSPGRAFQAC